MKTYFISETKDTERALLKVSDYYIVQNLEDSNAYPIPTEVSDYRAAVRAAATARCNEINAINSIADLQTLISGTGFTQWPDTPTTNYTPY